jgi:hypothetical protein
MTTRRVFIGLALTLLAASATVPRDLQAQETPAFVVIAHPGVKARAIRKSDLAAIFMHKRATWPGGGDVVPVDLVVSRPAREAFSRRVHGKGAKAVRNYWTQQIYSGKGTPPAEMPNDAKMLAKIVATPGAVGYVSGTASTEGAVVLTLND